MEANFYNILTKKANARPYLLGSNKELLFEMTETYGFIISFKEVLRGYEEEEEDDFLELEFEEQRERRFLTNDEVLTLPLISHTNYVQLYTTEIYGYREGRNTQDFRSQSISKTLYKLLRELLVLDKNIVIDYFLDTNEGFEDWGSMCGVGDYFNYLFLVNIKCTEEQLISVIDLLVSVNITPPTVSMHVAKEYTSLKKFTDSGRINILNTNTKARRLGYLKLLGRYFIKYPQSPYSQFHKRYESFVIPYQDQLAKSINPKGIVSPNNKGFASGNSAKPYIELANSLGFVNALNKIATPSKNFRVYVELLSQQQKSTENPFLLDLVDKSFFGENILTKDFLYLSVLIEMVYIKNSVLFSELKFFFRDSLIRRLKYFQNEYYYHKDKKVFDNVKKTEHRVSNWEEPESYLEHVLMPRLNWLVDLHFIELTKSHRREVIVTITDKGRIFFECLCDWYDLNFDWIINPDDFMAFYFPHIFAITYDLPKKDSQTDEQMKVFIKNLVYACFDVFRTMSANRVTLSQTISYVQYEALTKLGISLSKNYLNTVIQNEFNDSFVYRFQEQFSDGYLQKVND